MAAIVHFPSPDTQALAPLGWAPTRRPRRSGPPLRVLEGGRSPRAMVHVYRRRRVLAAFLLVAVAAAAVVVASWVVASVGAAGSPSAAPIRLPAAGASGPVLVVQSGDTLTSIARRLQPTGDTSSLIDRLSAIHGPGPLLAGDRLPLQSLGSP